MKDRLKSQVIDRETNKKVAETTVRNDERLIQGNKTKYEKSKQMQNPQTQKPKRCEEYKKEELRMTPAGMELGNTEVVMRNGSINFESVKG